MFKKLQFAGDYRAEVAVHGEVEGRVAVFDSIYVAAHFYFSSQLFSYFPLQCFLWSFSWLYFASRELPAILEIAVASLGGKELVILDNDGCYYMDGLHRTEYTGKVVVWKEENFLWKKKGQYSIIKYMIY